MFCKNCGRQIPDDAAFCPECGSKRSGGDAYGDRRSSASIKDLPSYAKEKDMNRSDLVVDTNREKFSLSGDSGKKKFSLAGQNKFSLSGFGQKKFSLQDKSGDDNGDGIVRLRTGREPDAPPAEPTGFVNPLKNSGKTVFKSDPVMDGANASVKPAYPGPAAPEPPPSPAAPEPENATVDQENETVDQENETEFNRPVQDAAANASAGGIPGEAPEEPTGFVNPLKGSDQIIHWGSDGDRNTKVGDIGEINSHMGFAIVMTILGGCDCISLVLGIIAIVFASKVSAHVQNGNYEEAKKCSDTALTLCWISLGLKIFFFILSTILPIIAELFTK